MKVCFQMIAFQADHILEPVLESILPYGPVVVTEGPVAYFAKQGFTTSTDRTNEILADLVGEKNVIHGIWREKDQMMNAAVPLIPPDTTHVWMVDADEVWKSEDIEKTLRLVDLHWLNSVSFRANSFFGGFDHLLGGFEEGFEVHRIQRWYEGARWETHRPPTVLSPSGVPWRATGPRFNHFLMDDLGVRFYHYSFVFPLQVRRKMPYYRSYSGAGHNIPNYFEKVWLPWVLCPDRRQEIEDRYDGVHDWKPERRGPARTRPFEGVHPKAIQARLPQLRQRFEKELQKIAWRAA